MTSPTTGPTSQGEPHLPAAERAASERAAIAVSRTVTQPRTFHAAQLKSLGRRVHTPMLRHASRFPQRPLDTVHSASDNALIASAPAESIAEPPPPRVQDSRHRPLLSILNRAGRLTFDAMLLIVFAPVIAVWWLNEKRQKQKSRN